MFIKLLEFFIDNYGKRCIQTFKLYIIHVNDILWAKYEHEIQ